MCVESIIHIPQLFFKYCVLHCLVVFRQINVGLDSATAAPSWLLHLPAVCPLLGLRRSQRKLWGSQEKSCHQNLLVCFSCLSPLAKNNLNLSFRMQGKDMHKSYQQLLVLVRLVYAQIILPPRPVLDPVCRTWWQESIPRQSFKAPDGQFWGLSSHQASLFCPHVVLICQLWFSCSAGSKDTHFIAWQWHCCITKVITAHITTSVLWNWKWNNLSIVPVSQFHFLAVVCCVIF